MVGYQHRGGSALSKLARKDSWKEEAACNLTDPSVFYPRTYDKHSDVVRKAFEICERCEVTEMCLNYALAAGEKHGIWGQTTPRDRAKMKRRR